MERAFGDSPTLVMGCIGGRSKAGNRSDQGWEAPWEKGTEGGGCTYTVHLSGHALCVISAVCPVFIIVFCCFFFGSLCMESVLCMWI